MKEEGKPGNDKENAAPPPPQAASLLMGCVTTLRYNIMAKRLGLSAGFTCLLNRRLTAGWGRILRAAWVVLPLGDGAWDAVTELKIRGVIRRRVVGCAL